MVWSVKKILVPVDGSDTAKAAVDVALDIAKQKKAKIVALFVVDVPHLFLAHNVAESVKDDLGKPAVNEVVRAAKKKGLKVKALIEEGHAADAILKVAEEENVDLIVMGTRGMSVMKKLLVGLGSIAASVIAHANCTVLAVREKKPRG